MKPNPSLVKDEKKQKLMQEINSLIKEKISEDYQLGHSYFMSELDVEFIKEYKIKPLLEEYFYGDEENYNELINILGLDNK